MLSGSAGLFISWQQFKIGLIVEQVSVHVVSVKNTCFIQAHSNKVVPTRSGDQLAQMEFNE